jgi:ATP-dependent DNA helicase RecQ
MGGDTAGILAQITNTLRSQFGFDAFRSGQAEAIQHLLEGKHTLVVMPTGAGKSLIYQLAALHCEGLTLVISPLIALMKDQVDSLTRHRIPATYINSTLPPGEQSRRLNAMSRGVFRLAYVAPERLRSVPFQEILSRVTVGLLAVDEAHCISQWGHDFRPDYLHIAAARAQMGNPLTAALTATATTQVQDDIVRLLGLPSAQRIVTGFNRPNLCFEVDYTTGPAAKFAALRDMLPHLDGGAALVYVGTRRDAEEVAAFIREVVRREAQHYHGKLEAETRARIQDDFMSGKSSIIVATNAFGMGIDRPDVRLVAHYAMPGTLEAYYQEAGRAGRDGQLARAVLLYDPEDRALQEWFIESEVPSLEDLRELYDALKSPTGSQTWRTTEGLSLITGQHEVKVKVALAQLETAGAVERMGDEGVRMLLRLGEWDEKGVRAATAQAEERRRHRHKQLEDMVRYSETNACRRRILLDHFGDKGSADAPRCCDNCLYRREGVAAPAAGDEAALSETDKTGLVILDTVRRLKWGVGRDKLAQVLGGSRAKDIQQFGYHKNLYYGRLQDFTQREIEGLIEQLVGQRYLKTIGGEFPVLGLTPRGEDAIKARAPISLHIPRRQMEKAARKKTERQAGGTLRLTEQLLAQGLSPAQIARQRNLSENTIYGHLAQLVGDGRIPVTAIVPKQVVAQVQAAIKKAGGAEALSPIKASLPEDISYEQIRCVAEAWKRERGEGDSDKEEIHRAILECVRSLPGQLPRSGVAKLLVGSPSERVESHRGHPLYGRFRNLSRDDVMREVDRLIEEGRLARTESGKVMLGSAAGGTPETDDIAAFLSRSHPMPLKGPWAAGWSLGFHSRFAGADWSRSLVGELVYRLKYQGDQAALTLLVEQALALFREHPELADADAIVAVPPSKPREFDPVGAVAEAMGKQLGLPVWPALLKTRQTKQQKEMQSLAQKHANVKGAFAVQGQVRGKKLLVLDDLYDSGATLEEAARMLSQAGAARVCVLTLTRTIHADA